MEEYKYGKGRWANYIGRIAVCGRYLLIFQRDGLRRVEG